MNDMASTIVAKSDQLNSDDLISGPITIQIRDTRVKESGEQRVEIFYHGDNNKPWKPCKSMCRALVFAWGDDSKQYIGRSLTILRDPEVTWAGMKVGGIRISHMSHITGELVMPLTVTRGSKKAYKVLPLQNPPAPRQQTTQQQTTTEPTAEDVINLKRGGELKAKKGSAELKAWWTGLGGTKQKAVGTAFLEEMKTIAKQVDDAQQQNQQPTGENNG